jgi:hypothetical protein
MLIVDDFDLDTTFHDPRAVQATQHNFRQKAINYVEDEVFAAGRLAIGLFVAIAVLLSLRWSARNHTASLAVPREAAGSRDVS